MAERIQRQRTKGWRMPDDAVYVGRPTRWGNPFTVHGRIVVDLDDVQHFARKDDTAAEMAVRFFRIWFLQGRLLATPTQAVAELRGKDLACWCPLDQPCHADVLLEIANA